MRTITPKYLTDVDRRLEQRRKIEAAVMGDYDDVWEECVKAAINALGDDGELESVGDLRTNLATHHIRVQDRAMALFREKHGAEFDEQVAAELANTPLNQS